MALLSQQLQKFLLSNSCTGNLITSKKKHKSKAIAIDAPSPADSAGVPTIRWGLNKLQGPRSEMEDDFLLRPDKLNGFTFAAVFDGHAGFSSVQFLRNELYRECAEALQGGLLLSGRDFSAITEALQKAFANVDTKLLTWFEEMGNNDESGATASAIFVGDDLMIVSHVGDSCVVISRSGKAEILTSPHRPYGNNKSSLSEIRRIREAGGWIVDGRICGNISVSRAFGDARFKTKKNEMLEKGVEEGRWTQKFISRVQFSGDLVTANPDIYQVDLGPDVEFILLASDGLWDYMSSSDAVAFVRNQLRQHGDVQIACEALVQAALDNRSQDNVSILVADLGKTDWRRVQPLKQNVILEIGQAFATVGIVSIGIWISSFLST
ncbi:probable protein phosphatase 2C 5 [Aristolochia californica]|uniref:probable protein phosphatase 2C 5 n=1 Tax=Aristolochia californica TaxID=171875 RepID=UPI0035D638EF